ncbi:hypothetical protein VNI00_017206 [Paramarasmius palmivorus]|uniref:Uncharacterized protein n=1 Tax=Paramarasmius palmivorus TaxID=297713 RepID=A0AAW0B8K4_9AGAR
MSGIKILNLEACEGQTTGNIDYFALCSLEVASPDVEQSASSVFQFTLKFYCEQADDGNDAHPRMRRLVHYEPIGWSMPSTSFSDGSGPVSPSATLRIEQLPFFIQGLLCRLITELQAEMNQDTGKNVILCNPKGFIFAIWFDFTLPLMPQSHSKLDDPPDNHSRAFSRQTNRNSPFARHNVESGVSLSSPSSQLLSLSSIGAGELVDPSRVPLFMQMPWFTDFVLTSKNRFAMLPSDLHAMATSLMKQFSEAYNKPPCRDIVLNQATLTPNQKSAGPLVSVLFGLRFLDVAAIVNSLETGGSEIPLDLASERPMVPRSVFEGQTGKLRGIALLCDNQGWPRVLSDIHTHMLSSGPVADPTLRSEEIVGSSKRQLLITAFRQLDCISQRDTNLMLVKALHNMESTAFFINYMLQGHFDFPLLWKTLVNELKTAATREGVSCEIATNLPPITRLRQPLFLALAVSPLILLCDITPMSSNLTRLHMLRAWYHYGNERPAILRKVESLLWRELFRMARGEVTSTVALQTFMEEALPLVSLARPEQDFFNPRRGSPAMMPIGLSYVSAESPLESAEWISSSEQRAVIREMGSSDQDVSGDDSDEDVSSSPPNVENAVSFNSGSGSVTGAVQRWTSVGPSEITCPWGMDVPGSGGILFNDTLQYALEGGDVDPGLVSSFELFFSPTATNLSSIATDGDSRPVGRMLIESTSAPEGSDLNITALEGPPDNTSLQDESVDERVESSGTFAVREDVSSRVSKAPGKTLGSRTKRRSALIQKPKAEKIIFEDWRKRITGDGYLLVSPTGGQCAYWPSSYNMRDLDHISELISRANSYQQLHGNRILFLKMTVSAEVGPTDDDLLSSPNGSPVEGMRILESGEYSKLDLKSQLSTLLMSQVVFMKGSTGPALVTRQLLNEIGSCSTMRDCIDLSFRWTDPFVKDLFASASLLDLMAQIERGQDGYSFYFPAIPRLNDKYTTPSLPTNVFSHRYTAGFPGYEAGQDSSPLRSNWYFVAPASVLHDGSIAPNGCNTELHVEAGIILVFLGRSDESSFLASYNSTSTPDKLLHGYPSVQGVLLFPGDKLSVPSLVTIPDGVANYFLCSLSSVFGPGIPHYLLTIEPSVCHGSYFYTTATMEQTYWSFVRRYLAASLDEPLAITQDHDTLCRIVLHWHDVIVRFTSDYLQGCSEQPGIVRHVPNILSFEGMIQLFSLSALILARGIFARERYLSHDDWKPMCDIYRRCRGAFREIFAALDSSVVFRRGGQQSQFGVMDLWTFYLVQQCSSLLTSAGKQYAIGIVFEDMKANFRQDLEGEHGVFDGVESVLSGSQFAFGKETEWSLSLQDCSSLVWTIWENLTLEYSIHLASDSWKSSRHGRSGYVQTGLGGVKRRRVLTSMDYNSASPVRIIKV